MPLTTSNREGKAATGLLLVFFAALLPPGVLLANSDALVAGQALLYLWAAGWGLFGILVLLWAARVDAFAITEDQVPPELRDQEEVVTATEQEESSPTGGEV